MSSTLRSFVKPACQDVAKAMGISGVIEIVIIVIIFIMLVFAAAYKNMPDPDLSDDIIAKAKYINGLVIASAIISIILLAVGIWHVVTANNVKKCILNGKPS